MLLMRRETAWGSRQRHRHRRPCSCCYPSGCPGGEKGLLQGRLGKGSEPCRSLDAGLDEGGDLVVDPAADVHRIEVGQGEGGQEEGVLGKRRERGRGGGCSQVALS